MRRLVSCLNGDARRGLDEVIDDVPVSLDLVRPHLADGGVRSLV
jgi:hypothetical protein